MACVATDPDVVLYGTGEDEKRVGPAEIQSQLERDFELRAGGQDIRLPARVTCVLEQRDGRWVIVNSHFSTPAAGQEEGHSF